MIFRTTGVTVLSFLFSISTQQNIHAAAPATSAGALKTAVDSQERKMHFEDDAAEYIEPVPLALQATPMKTTTGTLTSPVQGACTAAALSPLAVLYARKFPQGHTQEQAKAITRQFLPITLKPSLNFSIDGGCFDFVAWMNDCVHLAAVEKYQVCMLNAQKKEFVWNGQKPAILLYGEEEDSNNWAERSKARVHAARFIFDPYSYLPQERVYRVPEFPAQPVSWLPDGKKITDTFQGSEFTWGVRPYKIIAGKNDLEWDHQGMQFKQKKTQSIPHESIVTTQIWDAQQNEQLYDLRGQRETTFISWSNDNDRFATIPSYLYKSNFLYVWNIGHYNQFIAGKINEEQCMLIALLQNLRREYPADCVLLTLNQCTLLAQEPGITTAELARVLLTFDPEVKDYILEKLNISTKKNLLESDEARQDAQQPEDYLQTYQVFELTQHAVLGRIDDALEPLGKHDSVKKALEEYIVDERPTKTRYIDLFAQIHRVTEYHRLVMDNLFSAIKEGSLKDVLDNLNCETIDRQYTYHSGWSTVVYRTPLEQAIAHWDAKKPESDKIFNAILHYQEQLLPAEQHWMVKQDFGAAIKFALEQKRYQCALQIVQKMEQDPDHTSNLKQLAKDVLDENFLKIIAALGKFTDKK